MLPRHGHRSLSSKLDRESPIDKIVSNTETTTAEGEPCAEMIMDPDEHGAPLAYAVTILDIR
jgi:hypothetical protein